MKKCVAMLIPLLVLASFLSVYAMDDTGVKHSKNPAILKNEVLLHTGPGNYTELRHIVLKGTNEQIGKALGEIAREDYNVKLWPFADPIYAQARLDYIKENWPAFYERVKGIAKAYNVPLDSNLDLSALVYDVEYPDCSMVYFPPSKTSNGHAMSCKNMDFYKIPYDVFSGKVETSTQPDIDQRVYVLETYPDEGYSSLVLGVEALGGTALYGFNSQGLAIDSQVDTEGPNNPNSKLVGGRNSGVPAFMAARMILDNCKSIDEAKITILNNRIYQFAFAQHFMIYDKYGKSTIAEFQGHLDPVQDGSIHFTDYSDEISVMTNHPVYLLPTMEKVNEYIRTHPDETACYYNSIVRYKTLSDIISNHTENYKYTPDEMLDTLSKVYETVTGGSLTGGGHTDYIKARTLQNYLLDLTDGTLKIRFYLRDGWPHNEEDDKIYYCRNISEGPEGPIIFSKFFEFTLAKEKPTCVERCEKYCNRECKGDESCDVRDCVADCKDEHCYEPSHGDGERHDR